MPTGYWICAYTYQNHTNGLSRWAKPERIDDPNINFNKINFSACIINLSRYNKPPKGSVAERLNAPVLKTGVGS